MRCRLTPHVLTGLVALLPANAPLEQGRCALGGHRVRRGAAVGQDHWAACGGADRHRAPAVPRGAEGVCAGAALALRPGPSPRTARACEHCKLNCGLLMLCLIYLTLVHVLPSLPLLSPDESRCPKVFTLCSAWITVCYYMHHKHRPCSWSAVFIIWCHSLARWRQEPSSDAWARPAAGGSSWSASLSDADAGAFSWPLQVCRIVRNAHHLEAH